MKPTIDMSVSPYDRNPSAPASTPQPLVQLAYKPQQRFVPSRYNARTVADDGRVVLWNTLTGAVSIFKHEDKDGVIAHLSPKGVRAPLDKHGRYLEKRGFLVREDVNEMELFRYRYAQQHWRSDILQLILLASEDCNFRCVYCYEKFKHGTMEPEVREGVKALLTQRAPHLKSLGINWFGGEPLYGWEAIADLGPFIRETVDRHGLYFSQHMTTNAYLLTEERATKLLEWGCNAYQITIDGVAEDHDCKRVGRDGSPTHAVILDNLRSMHARKDAQFNIDIRINYDQKNFQKLGTFIEQLSEDFGGDRRFHLRFHPVGRWGGDNDSNLSVCGTDDQRFVMTQLRHQAVEAGLFPEGGIKGIAGMGAQVCYAGRPFNMIVGATGKLMKCTVALDDMPENVVGRLYPDGRLEINDVNMTKWVNPHFETDSLCQTCYALPGCQGAACPLTRVTEGKRTCCGAKTDLKREMRFTLAERDRELARAQEMALAGG